MENAFLLPPSADCFIGSTLSQLSRDAPTEVPLILSGMISDPCEDARDAPGFPGDPDKPLVQVVLQEPRRLTNHYAIEESLD